MVGIRSQNSGKEIEALLASLSHGEVFAVSFLQSNETKVLVRIGRP